MYRMLLGMIRLEHFFLLVEVYCAAAGIAEATLSTRMFNDGQRMKKLRDGRNIGVRTLTGAVQWLSTNWPKDAEWPADVQRPEAVMSGAGA